MGLWHMVTPLAVSPFNFIELLAIIYWILVESVRDSFRNDIVSSRLPDLYNNYVKHTTLVDEMNIHNSEGENCFILV
jgi:hypothetical protein